MTNSTSPITRREYTTATVSVLSIGFQGLAYARSRPGLHAGAAETIVTPEPRGTFLIGPMKPSTGVHDDLHARALVLSDGSRTAALITLDYLGFDFAYNDVLVDAIAKKTDIPRQHILINCSHTHSAPLTAPWGPWEKSKDRSFHKMLPEKLSEIVKKAVAGLAPARLRFRREPTQIGFNRRLLAGDRIVMAPNPHGVVLPFVDVLAVETPEGKPLAVLFSHAAHPVIVHAASTLISADYPGFAVQTVRRSYPALGMFAQGCCGNINAFPLQGGVDAARAAGKDLGNAVLRAVDASPDLIGNGPLKIASLELNLPLQPPPSAARCKEVLASEKNEERKKRLAELLTLAESGRTPTMRFPMRALAIGGEFCLLAVAHDTFAEYALHAQKVSPFPHTMVLAYTNGLECYVGTARDYELGERGGYETSWRGAALMFESRLPLAPRAEQLIQEGIRRLLQQIKPIKPVPGGQLDGHFPQAFRDATPGLPGPPPRGQALPSLCQITWQPAMLPLRHRRPPKVECRSR